MKNLTPTLLIFFLTISFAFAQSVSDSSLQECSVIQEPATRLVCYDTLINPQQKPYYCSDPAQSYRPECQVQPTEAVTQSPPQILQQFDQQKPEYCSNTNESWRTECGGDGVYQQQVTTQTVQESIAVINSNNPNFSSLEGRIWELFEKTSANASLGNQAFSVTKKQEENFLGVYPLYSLDAGKVSLDFFINRISGLASLTLHNQSNEIITVDLENSSFIDNRGTSFRLVGEDKNRLANLEVIPMTNIRLSVAYEGQIEMNESFRRTAELLEKSRKALNQSLLNEEAFIAAFMSLPVKEARNQFVGKRIAGISLPVVFANGSREYLTLNLTLNP